MSCQRVKKRRLPDIRATNDGNVCSHKENLFPEKYRKKRKKSKKELSEVIFRQRNETPTLMNEKEFF